MMAANTCCAPAMRLCRQPASRVIGMCASRRASITSSTNSAMPSDIDFMRLALAEATRAQARGEVPVGAVIVKNDQVIAHAGNTPIGLHDPSAHAEMLALRAAGNTLQNYRLDDT